MPVFEEDPYDLLQFHDAQLRHYGITKNLGPSTKAAANVATEADMRDVASRTIYTGPNRPRPPHPIPPLVREPGPRTTGQDIPAGTRTIFTGADGRFDVANVRTARNTATPPLSPSSPRWSRAESNGRRNSWRARRDSAGEYVRRLSISLKEKADIVAMDRNERVMFVRNRNANAEEEAVEDPGTPTSRLSSGSFGARARAGKPGSISKSEQFALSLSRAVDGLKTKGRNDEQMMEACERCFRPTTEYLMHGLCPQCHTETKERRKSRIALLMSVHLIAFCMLTDDYVADPATVSPGQEVPPISPGDRFLKLPMRKMVRIRRTVYEDPGNPFQEESNSNNREDEIPQISSLEDDDHSSPVSIKASEESDESATEDERGIVKTTRISQYSTPADASDPVTDQQRSDDQRYSKPDYRRSQSVALPMTKSWLDDENEEYVPPRALWRQQSIAAVDPVGGRHEAGQDARDTKFYGFYDEVWRDYQTEENKI